MNDIYQQRYLAHQAKKKEQLVGNGEEPKPQDNILKQRRSQRMFVSVPLSDNEMGHILEAATYAPSSCNRHGVGIQVITDRTDKALLSGIFVGAVGWAHRAHALILLWADPLAYKSPNEKEFMHYVDAGFLAMNMWLAAEQKNVGACYINPNCNHKDLSLIHI